MTKHTGRRVHSLTLACRYLAISGMGAVGSMAIPAFADVTCPIPKYLAPLPTTIANPHQPWGTTDTGAIVDGFVGLQAPPDILHGIDLSSNNVIKDYGVYSRCGGKFAFVRLDSAFAHHEAALTKEHWSTIPYVYMPVPSSMRQAARFGSLHSDDKDRIDSELQQFAAVGGKQADGLPDMLRKIGLTEIPRISFAGLSGRVIALDVEEKLANEQSTSVNARLYYGRFYARAICSWMQHARAIYPDILIIIYSTPSVFGDYLNFAYQQDDDCLRGIPLWMARTTRDGGDLIGVNNSKDTNDRYSQRACLQPAGNRCIFHQYSHRGVVGMTLPVSDPKTPHVDMNRAFPVKVMDDSKTKQYVRR